MNSGTMAGGLSMEALLLVPVFFPMLAGLFLFQCKKEAFRNRMMIAVLAVQCMLLGWLAARPSEGIVLWTINSRLQILFETDGLAKLFSCLMGGIWLIVGIYSLEYLKHENHVRRYIGLYVATIGVLTGVCYAGNLMTFYLFYEFMTLITAPLVIHSGTNEALMAGLKYLGYSIFGAGLVLIGFFFLNAYAVTTQFHGGGTAMLAAANEHKELLLVIYFIMMIGFGCKAGMFPLHAWLPTAHPVAPSPASAVLSGIITKAGVLGIIRTTYYLFGVSFLKGTWVQLALLVIITGTVFMGSMLAYKEKLLKKRFAYSTISQVSYVLFGLLLMTPLGFLGALLQVVYHAVVKNCMFLCAGSVIYKTGKKYAYEMRGVGKQMPIVMWCLAFAALSLIGIPPFGGFISKWYLAQGGLLPEFGILGITGTAVLLISALLTAGYLLPLLSDAFFPGSDFDYDSLEKAEPSFCMTGPLMLLAFGALLLGVFPNILIDMIMEISRAAFG